MVGYKYKIGDRVRLVSYEEYGDWSRHSGEDGIIKSLNNPGFRDKYTIRWKDGSESFAPENNIVLLSRRVVRRWGYEKV